MQDPFFISPPDALLLDGIAENKTTFEDIQSDLALWTNIQFAYGSLVETESPQLFDYVSLDTDSITYEKLANYLDFELPRKDLLVPNDVIETDLLPGAIHTIDSRKKTKKNKYIEEEKRKRNTDASARFRIKKKQRVQIMEQAVKDMSEKSKELEDHVHELESEIEFLKSLLLEKDSCKTLFEETIQSEET